MLVWGKILNWIDPLYMNESIKKFPDSPLTNWLKRPWVDLEEGMRRRFLTGLSRSFTYPVVDIDAAVQNVVTKSSIFNTKSGSSEKALWVLGKKFC